MANNIYEALLAVYKEVGYVQKTGKIDAGHAKYTYAGERDLIEALRPAMLKQGIVVLPQTVRDCTYHVIEKQGGKHSVLAAATYVYRFVHAATSTHHDVEVRGEGYDTLDKASYKAATGALKYALRQSFLIETGDDPDEDTQAKAKEDAAKAWLASFTDSMTKLNDMNSLIVLLDQTKERRQRIADGYPQLITGMDAAIAANETRLKDSGNESY